MFFNQNIGENICVNVYDTPHTSTDGSYFYTSYDGGGNFRYCSTNLNRQKNFKTFIDYSWYGSTGGGKGWGGMDLATQYYSYVPIFYCNNLIFGENLKYLKNNKKIIKGNIGWNSGITISHSSIDGKRIACYSEIRRRTYVTTRYYSIRTDWLFTWYRSDYYACNEHFRGIDDTVHFWPSGSYFVY